MRVLFSRLCLLVMLLLMTGITIAQDNAEATETPEPIVPITIWWPDVIARVDDATINPILLNQTAQFADENPQVIFEHRMKAVGTTGGIMSTLRTANNAATGALPTITLIRRQDMIAAHSSNYIQSVNSFSLGIRDDLENTILLGRINDTLFGIPYMIELQHVVYRPSPDVDYTQWTYDAVIARGDSFIFPAGRANSLNSTVALQYIESGGAFTSENGFILNEDALTSLFDFYQTSVDNELINGLALNYTSPDNYFDAFRIGDFNTAVMSSTDYLDLTLTESDLQIAPIPTEDGNLGTFMNGWMWVVVTTDAQEQAIALDYIQWMMDTERQVSVGEAVGMLPSRDSALTMFIAGNEDLAIYDDFIDVARLPLTDSEIGVIGRSIQTNFASILTLENTAEDAVQAVVDETN